MHTKTMTENLATVTNWLVSNGYVDAQEIKADSAGVCIWMTSEDVRMLGELTSAEVTSSSGEGADVSVVGIFFAINGVKVDAYSIEVA